MRKKLTKCAAKTKDADILSCLATAEEFATEKKAEQVIIDKNKTKDDELNGLCRELQNDKLYGDDKTECQNKQTECNHAKNYGGFKDTRMGQCLDKEITFFKGKKAKLQKRRDIQAANEAKDRSVQAECETLKSDTPGKWFGKRTTWDDKKVFEAKQCEKKRTQCQDMEFGGWKEKEMGKCFDRVSKFAKDKIKEAQKGANDRAALNVKLHNNSHIFSKTERVGKQAPKKRQRIDRLCRATKKSNGLNPRTPKEIAALKKFDSKKKYTKAEFKELTGLTNSKKDLDQWKREFNEYKEFLPKAIKAKQAGKDELIKKHGGLQQNAHKASDILSGLVKLANKEPNKRKSFKKIQDGLKDAIKKQKVGMFGSVSGVGDRLKEVQAEINGNSIYKHFDDRFKSKDLTCKQSTSYGNMISGKRQPEAQCEAAAKNAYQHVKEIATRHATKLKSQSPLDDKTAQDQKVKIETQLEILKEAKEEIANCDFQPIVNKAVGLI